MEKPACWGQLHLPPPDPQLQLQFRSWHDAQAIARAHAITHANQEKGGLRGR